jgi:hypothetical protein
MGFTKILDHFPGIVGAAIVDKNDFVPEIVLFTYHLYPAGKFGQGFSFIKQWDNNRYIK